MQAVKLDENIRHGRALLKSSNYLTHHLMNNQVLLSPQQQKEYFLGFIDELVDKFKPLYIYSFGEFTSSNSKKGCFIENCANESFHYYLLMVTENVNRVEHHVQDYCNSHFRHGVITIIVHGKDTVIESIRANNRFFITVANSGELLYNHDSFIHSFQVPCFIPTKAADKAAMHYNRSKDLAKGFLDSAMECLRSCKYHLCVFMLHQVVEQCCIGMIRVYLGYRSDIHNLYRLLSLCNSFSTGLSSVFLERNERSKRLFDIMVKSYTAARYQDHFLVIQSDAEELYDQVSCFLKLTEDLCTEKIELLAADAAAYKQLKVEKLMNIDLPVVV